MDCVHQEYLPGLIRGIGMYPADLKDSHFHDLSGATEEDAAPSKRHPWSMHTPSCEQDIPGTTTWASVAALARSRSWDRYTAYGATLIVDKGCYYYYEYYIISILFCFCATNPTGWCYRSRHDGETTREQPLPNAFTVSSISSTERML